jgi:hypothetical protein
LKGGRATVEFVLRKPDNAPFDVEGVNYPEAKMVMVIGEFVALVVVAVVVVDDDDDDDDDVCSY